MAEKILLVEKRDRVCRLIMNRPRVMNALNQEMIEEFLSAAEELASDPEVRVVVLEGAGDNFCSGADISIFAECLSAPVWLAGMRKLGRFLLRLRELPQPIVVKLRGAAIGGGANLALAGDFVVAAKNARFCENFANIGLVLDAGGTFFLPRLVGLPKARELALLGDTIDGETAAAIGLIYKCVPEEELDREVDELAGTLAQKPPAAMALIKEGLEGSLDMSLKEVLQMEAANQSVMLQTTDHREAVEFFLTSRAKRKG